MAFERIFAKFNDISRVILFKFIKNLLFILHKEKITHQNYDIL